MKANEKNNIRIRLAFLPFSFRLRRKNKTKKRHTVAGKNVSISYNIICAKITIIQEIKPILPQKLSYYIQAPLKPSSLPPPPQTSPHREESHF